jgi:uncharacterized protein
MEPQLPWLITALGVGFKPLHKEDYEKLIPFYSSLRDPLADLDALMMIAWRAALLLHFLIEDDVLYMLANWEGKPVFWGPPIGKNLDMLHINRGFELLRRIEPTESKHQIRYLWEDHKLWLDIISSGHFDVVRQSTEYLYDVSDLATLSSPQLKKKRYSYRTFKLEYCPQVVPYSLELREQCLALLDTWAFQKEKRINPKYWEKFESERTTCKLALDERLPMIGVAAIVDGTVGAFSIGGPQTNDCFNCMFEKTNLEMRGASAFIFAELAKSCIEQYKEINAGEDWEVEYLRQSKQLWKPRRTHASFILYENS